MAARVPATVITGFLGAGKTTLIRHLLANADGRRIALIVNEFGDVGVDGAIVSDCDDAACGADDVVELANGCICCTVADDFIPTMELLLARDPAPDHIVIETSGLALPQPLVQAFNWPEVKARVTVDGVVTVIDARAVADGRFAADDAAVAAQRAADASLDHESPLHELFEDQLGCADLIVLNKTDLVDAAELQQVEDIVAHEKRDAARTVTAIKGALKPEVLIGLGMAAEDDLATRHGHHHGDGADHEPHDHDDFESFVVAMPEVSDPRDVAMRISAAVSSHDILRTKGFIAVAGKPMRLVVQGVGPRVDSYFDRAWRQGEARTGRLVVIGETGLDRAAIATELGGTVEALPTAVEAAE